VGVKDGDFITLNRKWVESFHGDITMGGCFVYLLLKANWEDRTVYHGRLTIKRGQLVTSFERLAEAWGCGHSTAHRRMNKLVEYGCIKMGTVKIPKKGTLVTLIKYGDYQDMTPEMGQQRDRSGIGAGQERDQKNKRTTKQENKKTPLPPTIPDEFSDALRTATETWIKHKIERREGYKPTGLKMVIGRITNVAKDEGEKVVIDAIGLAISNGWKGWDFPDRRQRASGGVDDPHGNLGRMANIIREERSRNNAQGEEQQREHQDNGDGGGSGGDVPTEDERTSDQTLLLGFGGS